MYGCSKCTGNSKYLQLEWMKTIWNVRVQFHVDFRHTTTIYFIACGHKHRLQLPRSRSEYIQCTALDTLHNQCNIVHCKKHESDFVMNRFKTISTIELHFCIRVPYWLEMCTTASNLAISLIQCLRSQMWIACLRTVTLCDVLELQSSNEEIVQPSSWSWKPWGASGKPRIFQRDCTRLVGLVASVLYWCWPRSALLTASGMSASSKSPACDRCAKSTRACTTLQLITMNHEEHQENPEFFRGTEHTLCDSANLCKLGL